MLEHCPHNLYTSLRCILAFVEIKKQNIEKTIVFSSNFKSTFSATIKSFQFIWIKQFPVILNGFEVWTYLVFQWGACTWHFYSWKRTNKICFQIRHDFPINPIEYLTSDVQSLLPGTSKSILSFICTHKTLFISAIAFVLLYRNLLAITELGNELDIASVRWSINLKGMLC